MKKIINIGLNSNVNNLSEHAITLMSLKALKKLGSISGTVFKLSTTENTLIVYIETFNNQFDNNIFKLCDAIEQDCIAVYDVELNKGKLIGSLAKKWGSFNIDYFLKG